MNDWEIRLTVEELKDILNNLSDDSEIVFEGLDGCQLEFHRCKVEKKGLVRIELRNPQHFPKTAIEQRAKAHFYPLGRG